jgi:hypothetical protein
MPFFDRQFRELHQNSTLTLCVCEGMLAALGPHPGAQVLYPMPGGSAHVIKSSERTSANAEKLNVFYMGNLGDYGDMVQAALAATKLHPAIRLEIAGSNPTWPPLFKKDMQERGLYHDFLPEEKLGDWLATADAFLVTMRFEPHLRRFMETSFPSKMMHYAQFHKPIVIWGPEYCSAVRWARINDSALCVTDSSPSALIRAMESLAGLAQQHLAANARVASFNDFNPDRIQKQFLTAIQSAVRKHNAP